MLHFKNAIIFQLTNAINYCTIQYILYLVRVIYKYKPVIKLLVESRVAQVIVIIITYFQLLHVNVIVIRLPPCQQNVM